MSNPYPPPTILSIFNSINFLYGNDNLTINTANQRYLQLSGGTISPNRLRITNTNASTNSTSGALQVLGGGYFGANSLINGNLSLTNSSKLQLFGTTSQINLIDSASTSFISIANNSSSTGSGTGALRVSGGCYFANDSMFETNLKFSSNISSEIYSIRSYRGTATGNGSNVQFTLLNNLGGRQMSDNGAMYLLTMQRNDSDFGATPNPYYVAYVQLSSFAGGKANVITLSTNSTTFNNINAGTRVITINLSAGQTLTYNFTQTLINF